ncbi:MAG TPA: hypothetical protein VFN23_00175 [Ktedonobacteraceae bacterium]|nr:hypothetical protein [Ktedonobacteraceae bacterium]
MALFEAPAAHEAVHYNNPYNSPEFEDEWEVHEGHPYNVPESSHYNSPEFEDEWEIHEGHHYNVPESSHFNSPEFEDEWEVHEGHPYNNPYNSPEFEDEWEVHEGHPYNVPESSHYNSPEFEEENELLGNIMRGIGGLFGGGGEEIGHEMEDEFEDEASHFNNPEEEYEIGQILGALGLGEGEFEADPFFGKLRGLVNRVKKVARRFGKFVGPLARRLAPIAARALGSMIPGVGAIAGPLAGKLVGSLVSEAEMEVAEMENHLLSMLAQEGEAEHPEVQEALMAELMAANAAEAESEDEAEAMVSASLPLTMRVMRAQHTLLPVTPVLVQANARLVRTLRRQGRGGRQLLRLLPAIHRNTIAILRLLGQSQRITTPTAIRAMSIATKRLMSNPQRTRRAARRNIAMQMRATRMNRQRGSLPLRPLPRRQRVAL